MACLLYTLLTGVIGFAVLGSVLYLLAILAAALRRPQETAPAPAKDALHLTVLVPAHDEELVLAQTLNSLLAQDYPAENVKIIVIADNCTDSTADLALAHGVTVWKRFNLSQRGKGYALDWTISQLLARDTDTDAFVVVDADTFVASDFLTRMAARLHSDTDVRGLCALQGRYGVLNGIEGWRAALMSAAFDLVNHVRPLGRDRLKLSVGLKGNGMAFTRETFARVRWHGGSLTEDLDFALDLARKENVRVGYVPDARVWAQMPTNAAQATSQRRRWEEGRAHAVRHRALPLLWEGISRGKILLIDAALDLLLLPLVELAALTLTWLLLLAFGIGSHLLAHPLLWTLAGACALEGFLTFVLGGLRAANAPREAYVALLRAPFYAVWKLALRVASASAIEPEWIRTERAPITGGIAPVPAKTEAPVP